MQGTPEERMPKVDDLLAFILNYIQIPARRTEFKVASEKQREFLLLFGLTHRVRRLAQSFLRLRKDGFDVEGQILLRSALEHAVTAQWAYLAKGGMSQLQVSASKDQYSLVKLIGHYSTDPNMPTVVNHFAERVESGAQLPTVTELMKQLDNNGFLRTSYKVLSQVTHVTHQSSLDALDTDAGGNITLRLEPENEFAHQSLYVLASCCLLSAWIVAHLEDDSDEIARLLEVGTLLAMPCRLDGSLPNEVRRFDNDDVSYEDL